MSLDELQSIQGTDAMRLLQVPLPGGLQGPRRQMHPQRGHARLGSGASERASVLGSELGMDVVAKFLHNVPGD